MLRANRGQIRRVLLGMEVVFIAHDEDEDKGNRGGGGGGNHIEDNVDNDNAVRKGKSTSLYLSCNMLRVGLSSTIPPGKEICLQEHGAVQ
jgi:hypothetical protein